MFGRWYLTRSFRGITLFVLMAFTLPLLVGCSETKVTNSKSVSKEEVAESPINSAVKPAANYFVSNAKSNASSIKKGPPLPAPEPGIIGEGYEPPSPGYLVTGGPELQRLLGQALGNASVSAAKSYLQGNGFSYSPWYALGAVDPAAGNEVVYLPFYSDLNTTAYLIHARTQTGDGSSIGYTKISNYPPGNGYEYWTSFEADDGTTKNVWVKSEQRVSVGNSTVWVQSDCNSRYWKCLLGGALLGCGVATLRCLIMGPATLICAATGCAFAMIPVSLGCGIQTAQGCR